MPDFSSKVFFMLKMLPKSTTKQTLKCSQKFLGGSSVEVPQEMLHYARIQLNSDNTLSTKTLTIDNKNQHSKLRLTYLYN